MTIIGWPALFCSVVWRPLRAPLAQPLVPLCLKGNLSLPLTPLYALLMIFCATSEKDSETQQIQIAGTYMIIYY